MSRALPWHRGKHSFHHSDRAREVRFELPPQYLELNVFRKSGHGKSGIVDQPVGASVIARHGVYNGSDVQKFWTSSGSGIDPVRNADFGRALIELGDRPRARGVARLHIPLFANSVAVRSLMPPELSARRAVSANVRKPQPAEFLVNMPDAR